MGEIRSLTRGLATRSVAAAVAVAFLGASVGTSSLAFAQAKAPAKEKEAPKGKAEKPVGKAKEGKKEEKKEEKKDDKKEAGKHFKAGKEAFEKKSYKDAKAEFMKAEETVPAAAAEYYIGRCSEELGESADAASWYQKAIDAGKLKDDQATDAKSRLDTLKKKPAKVKITSDPPGGAISVDGKPYSEKTPAEIELTPGPHKIAVKAEGKKPSEQDVDVAPFTGAAVVAKLEGAPVEAADDPFKNKPAEAAKPPEGGTTVTVAPTTDTGTGKRDMTWVYVTGGAAVVALGVGTFFGLAALSDKKDFDATPTRDTRDKGTRDALIADMGFGIGITLAVTSAVLYFTSPSKEASAATKKPTMAFAPVIGAPTAGHGVSLAGASATFNF
jgi:hypothetical protein